MKNANCIKNIESKKENFPKEWRFFPLAKVIDFNPKRELEKGRHSKFISMADVQVFTKKISSFSVKKNFNGKKFKNGDTIMARITPCLENGKTSFIDFLEEGEIAAGSTEFIVLSGKKDVSDSNFVYYLSISPSVRSMAIKTMTGTSGRQRVDNEKLVNSIIALPSIIEQKQIAEILSSLDDKIELNRKINSNLEKIASLLFKQWFVDFEFPNENGELYRSSGGKMIDSELGEIPEGWKISKIGDELNTILGGTPRRNNDDYWDNGNISWINSGAINNFPIIESSEFITKKGLDNSATKLMPVKTVVLPFVISLGKEIKISILGIETSGNQSVLGIIENERFSAEYIYYWIEKNKNSIYGWATGGAQQHINKQNVDETSILIPPKDIMDKFRIITVPIFDNIISNSILNKQVEKLRNSLLPRLMNGKIRVNKKYE